MKPVMLATDGSPTAEKATATAIELASLLDTELVIVTAWDMPYSTLGYGAIPVNAEMAQFGKETAEKVAAQAAALADEAGVESRTVILRGFPVDEICLAAEKYEPRFLIVGSHGWGTMKRMLFGSVSTGVLHHATCPVLVIRGEPVEEEPTEERAREKVEA